jgi:hypothetical protein
MSLTPQSLSKHVKCGPRTELRPKLRVNRLRAPANKAYAVLCMLLIDAICSVDADEVAETPGSGQNRGSGSQLNSTYEGEFSNRC